jgi:hypothetical protein
MQKQTQNSQIYYQPRKPFQYPKSSINTGSDLRWSHPLHCRWQRKIQTPLLTCENRSNPDTVSNKSSFCRRLWLIKTQALPSNYITSWEHTMVLATRNGHTPGTWRTKIGHTHHTCWQNKSPPPYVVTTYIGHKHRPWWPNSIKFVNLLSKIIQEAIQNTRPNCFFFFSFLFSFF